MHNTDYVTITGSKEAVNLLRDFFLKHGFELDTEDELPDQFLYHAPPTIPTEIIVALIGCAGSIIVQMMQIFEQRKKEKDKEKKGNSITLTISITQETTDSYAISVKGDSPENLQIITQTLSMIDDSLKKD